MRCKKWKEHINKVTCADARNFLARIPDNKVALAVTSPPYFLNKSYEKSWSLLFYKKLMRKIFIEVARVLSPGGYFVVNFGDYFNSGNRFYSAEVPSVYPASLNFFRWGRKANLDLQATRIWRKQFARMGIPFVCNTHPRNIFDYEHIWTFRKQKGNNKEFVNDRKLSQRGVIGEDWTKPAGIKIHEACFPIELPLWAINVYSSSDDDIILDPFMGAWTTAIAAVLSHRSFIGCELKEENCKTGEKRLREIRKT